MENKVDNQLEQDFIVAIMKIHPDYWIWLGGSYVETEERFVWNHSGRPAGQEYRMNCYLVEVDNQFEQDFIVAIMKIYPDYWIWLGGSYEETEERFVWNHSGRPAGQEYQMNSYLVEVDNQFEQDFIVVIMKIHPDYWIWLGGSCIETEERFVWNHSGRPAGQECRMNSYLVEADNQFEQDFIVAIMKIHHNYWIWLGGSYVETEERFVWNH